MRTTPTKTEMIVYYLTVVLKIPLKTDSKLLQYSNKTWLDWMIKNNIPSSYVGILYGTINSKIVSMQTVKIEHFNVTMTEQGKHKVELYIEGCSKFCCKRPDLVEEINLMMKSAVSRHHTMTPNIIPGQTNRFKSDN